MIRSLLTYAWKESQLALKFFRWSSSLIWTTWRANAIFYVSVVNWWKRLAKYIMVLSLQCLSLLSNATSVSLPIYVSFQKNRRQNIASKCREERECLICCKFFSVPYIKIINKECSCDTNWIQLQPFLTISSKQKKNIVDY